MEDSIEADKINTKEFYVITIDGTKEMIIDLLVETKEDLIRAANLYCKEFKHKYVEDSLEVNFKQKEVTFTVDNDFEVEWRLVKLRDPKNTKNFY